MCVYNIETLSRYRSQINTSNVASNDERGRFCDRCYCSWCWMTIDGGAADRYCTLDTVCCTLCIVLYSICSFVDVSHPPFDYRVFLLLHFVVMLLYHLWEGGKICVFTCDRYHRMLRKLGIHWHVDSTRWCIEQCVKILFCSRIWRSWIGRCRLSREWSWYNSGEWSR